MIKIAFSGLPSSGKTSLLEEVKKILSLKYKVDSVDEIHRKNPFDESMKSSFISQFFFLSTQINEENIKGLKAMDYLLCDRCILDHWVYWKNYLSDKEVINGYAEKDQIFHKLFQLWIKSYNMIFLIKVDLKKLEERELNNELRVTDMEYLGMMETSFNQVIKDEQVNVIEIWNNGSLDENAEKIVKMITDYKDLSEG